MPIVSTVLWRLFILLFVRREEWEAGLVRMSEAFNALAAAAHICVQSALDVTLLFVCCVEEPLLIHRVTHVQ